MVTGNLLQNKHLAARLPAGAEPSVATFIVESIGAGEVLYENQDELFAGNSIFVGIDLVSGYFCVEGCSLLWDELYAFQGLDDSDLQYYYCVAEYVSCLRRFDLLKHIAR